MREMMRRRRRKATAACFRPDSIRTSSTRLRPSDAKAQFLGSVRRLRLRRIDLRPVRPREDVSIWPLAMAAAKASSGSRKQVSKEPDEVGTANGTVSHRQRSRRARANTSAQKSVARPFPTILPCEAIIEILPCAGNWPVRSFSTAKMKTQSVFTYFMLTFAERKCRRNSKWQLCR